MAAFTFVCCECAARYARPRCATSACCAVQQQPGGVTRGVLSVEIDELPARWPAARVHDPGALTAFCRSQTPSRFRRCASGTPLLPSRLRVSWRCRTCGSRTTPEPFGSTKDRARCWWSPRRSSMAAGPSRPRRRGMPLRRSRPWPRRGSARRGVRAASAPPAKLVQMASYGAQVCRDGSYDDAFELSLTACERFGWYSATPPTTRSRSRQENRGDRDRR